MTSVPTGTEHVFLNTLEMLQERLTEEEFQLVAVIMRQVWLRRNDVIFGRRFSSPAELVRKAQD